MKVSEQKFERINPPEGTHFARLIRIIDCGTQHSDKFGTDQHKIRMTFELVDEKYEFDEAKGEQPFLIDRQYTLNLNPKASLRKDMEAWRGKKFTKAELEDGFDMKKLINSAGQVQIVHTPSADGDATYANIGALMAAPKGIKVTRPENDRFLFSIEEFDQELFDSFPDWIREMIESSPEYQEMNGETDGSSDILN